MTVELSMDEQRWINVSHFFPGLKYQKLKVRAHRPGEIIAVLAIAQKYDLTFVDRFDEMKSLTKLEQAIWSINE